MYVRYIAKSQSWHRRSGCSRPPQRDGLDSSLSALQRQQSDTPGTKEEEQEVPRCHPDPAPSRAMDVPRNRKQGQAAAAAAAASSSLSNPNESFDPSSIPLARPPPPDTSKKNRTKTLYEIAAERQEELLRRKGKSSASAASGSSSAPSSEPPEAQFFQISPDGEVSRFKPSDNATDTTSTSDKVKRSKGAEPEPNEANDDVSSIPPFVDTIMLSLPLAAVHCTLAFLAAHQYAQDIPVRSLIRESAVVAFPVLTFLIHLAHGHIVSFGGGRKNTKNNGTETSELTASSLRRLLLNPTPRTIFFLPLAVYLGSYLIALTNQDPYYAVMKRAPAIGTLWVWCVLEMSAGAAALGVLVPIGWGVLWKGYGII
ncbi:hypothetical protein VTN00DRAFT_4218 [Thermoascus crustaceus]|uniref:uncharacterized protein n=1 Tax=Thermoascus crustaceus TaxID=5088 RepID=UPI00374293DA